MVNPLNWTLIYDEYIPEQQGLREALCTLGNGYFATRGTFPEVDADEHHYPGTYLAGGYNRLKTEVAGRVIENEDLVNMPNWLPLKFRIEEGEWFHLGAVKVLSFSQELDLECGILRRNVHFRDAHGRETKLEESRFVHMKHFHLAGIRWNIKSVNWSGAIEILSALDGRVRNDGVPRYRELNSAHLESLDAGVNGDQDIFLKVQTNQGELRIVQAARHRVFS